MKDKQLSPESNVIPKNQPNTTIVGFALDETGSMLSCLDQTINGYNQYIDELKKSESEIKVSLVKFDTTKLDAVYVGNEIKNVPELNRQNYQPGQGTNLYDAIAHTIELLGKQISSYQYYPNVLCVILTDGAENASTMHNKKSITKLINKKQKYGWTFVYLGANQDAWAVGSELGFKKNNTMSYDVANTESTFQQLATATAAYVSTGSVQTENFFNQSAGVV